MQMADTNLASAIAVTEPDTPNSSSNALKRRQSESSDQEQGGKRQRTSPGKIPPTASTKEVENSEESAAQDKTSSKLENTREPRRKSSVADDKQRTKRLFGALLGNLNQPGDRAAKRRQEIEQRRKAELQQQDERHAQNRQQRQERLAEQRQKEQIRVDEMNMRIRHRHLLNTANFLQTTAEPRIYYRPWELYADEEDRIDDQIADAQKQIDAELDEFDQLHDMKKPSGNTDNAQAKRPQAEESDDDDHSRRAASTISTIAKDGEDSIETDKSAHDGNSRLSEPQGSDKTNIDTDDAGESQDPNGARSQSKRESDEEDHVVEGGEDTVIY